MDSVSPTIARARAAKSEVRRSLGSDIDVVGVGIAKSGRGYALKVNLAKLPKGKHLPKSIGGIPVRFEVVGRIRKRVGT
ncbi:MAG: hypothetical protein AB7O88_27045 [Reyranellaceae bacterium]